jgi:hypothetical protein
VRAFEASVPLTDGDCSKTGHIWKVGGYADLDERIRCRELLAATTCIPDIRIDAENDRNVGMDRNATIKIKDVMSLSSTRTNFTILRDINRTLR